MNFNNPNFYTSGPAQPTTATAQATATGSVPSVGTGGSYKTSLEALMTAQPPLHQHQSPSQPHPPPDQHQQQQPQHQHQQPQHQQHQHQQQHQPHPQQHHQQPHHLSSQPSSGPGSAPPLSHPQPLSSQPLPQLASPQQPLQSPHPHQPHYQWPSLVYYNPVPGVTPMYGQQGQPGQMMPMGQSLGPGQPLGQPQPQLQGPGPAQGPVSAVSGPGMGTQQQHQPHSGGSGGPSSTASIAAAATPSATSSGRRSGHQRTQSASRTTTIGSPARSPLSRSNSRSRQRQYPYSRRSSVGTPSHSGPFSPTMPVIAPQASGSSSGAGSGSGSGPGGPPEYGDIDGIILSMHKQNKPWAQIAAAAKLDSEYAAQVRYQQIMSGQPVGTSSSSIPQSPMMWDKDDIDCLRELLDVGERAKWKYVATELTRDRNKRITAVACQKKFKEMFGVAEASSMLGSSLCYVVSPSGWSSLDQYRPIPSSVGPSMYMEET